MPQSAITWPLCFPDSPTRPCIAWPNSHRPPGPRATSNLYPEIACIPLTFTNAYVGLVVSSTSNTTLATATFDYVSVSSTASPGPSITRVSAQTPATGSQVVITGSGFGATQGASAVTLSGSPMLVNSWSDTSIVITISTSATSGYLVVSVAPSMNNSNVVDFSITTQPLPRSEER